MTVDAPRTAEDVLDELRTPSRAAELFAGFGPLVLAVALLVAMVLLAPSVAPERIVERPVEAPTGETGAGS